MRGRILTSFTKRVANPPPAQRPARTENPPISHADGPVAGITARSDRTAVTFGKGLPEDELAYLHALIRKSLTD